MTQFVLRPYQVLIRDHILNHGLGSVFASPGMGKTSATAPTGSAVHSVGSSLASSYPEVVIAKAELVMHQAGR